MTQTEREKGVCVYGERDRDRDRETQRERNRETQTDRQRDSLMFYLYRGHGPLQRGIKKTF